MINIDKKTRKIILSGALETLNEEIGVAMLALCDQAAKIDPDLAKVVLDHAVMSIRVCLRKLEDDHGIDTDGMLNEIMKDAGYECEDDEDEDGPQIPGFEEAMAAFKKLFKLIDKEDK